MNLKINFKLEKHAKHVLGEVNEHCDINQWQSNDFWHPLNQKIQSLVKLTHLHPFRHRLPSRFSGCLDQIFNAVHFSFLPVFFHI